MTWFTVRLTSRCDVGGCDLAQLARGQQRAAPCPEVLGTEILAHHRAQIRVHRARVYRLAHIVVVDVLEQVITGQVPAHLDDARHAAVVQLNRVLLPTLADKLEAQCLCPRRRRGGHVAW